MMSLQDGSAKILEEIKLKADAEVKKIEDEASHISSRIVEHAKKEAERIKQHAEEQAQAQIQQERERRASKARLEAKMEFLKKRAELLDQLISEGYQRVLEELKAKETRLAILKNMIIEAAIALDGGELVVKTNEAGKEVLTDSVLSQIATELQQTYQVTTKLSLSPETISTDGGVIISDKEETIFVENTLEHILEREKENINIQLSSMIFSEE